MIFNALYKDIRGHWLEDRLLADSWETAVQEALAFAEGRTLFSITRIIE